MVFKEPQLDNYFGNSLMIDIEYKDEDGLPEDFTNASFLMAIGAEQTIVESTSGVTITGGADGICHVFVTGAAMEDIAVGSHDIEVLASWASGRKETLLKGTLTVWAGVRVEA